jgi:hypothetical protein
MTVITITQNTPVLVAIDIAKARHEVLIAVPGKKRRRRLTVLNELADFTRLITALKDYGRPVRAAFEAMVITTAPWLIIWQPQVLK